MKQPVFLFVINHAGVFLTHRLPTAREAQHKGFKVHVAAPASADFFQELLMSDAVSAIQAEGIMFHDIPLSRRTTQILTELRTVYQLYRLYRQLKPDIVYSSTIKPVIYGSLMARLARLPAVVNLITGLGYVFSSSGLKAKLLKPAVTIAYKLALGHPNSKVIFQNHDDRTTFVRAKIVKESATAVVKGSGVNLSHYRVVDEPLGIPIVILASRMLWDKGVAEFVQAAHILHEQGVQARFVLVGDRDPSNPSSIPAENLEAWQSDGVIEWWGWQRDMIQVFARSHIVCLPSYREGMPKVLIEAAACGKPILAADTPGCREIVQHEVNGLLVPVKNAPALAAAMHKLIDDPHLRFQMGLRGRELVEAEFSDEIVVRRTMEICESLLKPSVRESGRLEK